MSAIEYRDLVTLDDFTRVVELEKRIWGLENGDDVVPLPVLAVTVRRGAVLVGAFSGPKMVGFVYSIPAVHQGRLSHWSHMLGVSAPYGGAVSATSSRSCSENGCCGWGSISSSGRMTPCSH